jgi:hypothetical protein
MLAVASSTCGIPASKIAVTPMIGMNDTSSETFTAADVETLTAYAGGNGLATSPRPRRHGEVRVSLRVADEAQAGQLQPGDAVGLDELARFPLTRNSACQSRTATCTRSACGRPPSPSDPATSSEFQHWHLLPLD